MRKSIIKNILALSLSALLIWISCGNPPEPLPEIYTGSARIAALDTLLIDSINISVDGIRLGMFRNPYLFTSLVAGEHKFEVSTKDASADPQIISIQKNRLTRAYFNIETAGPYINRKAPLFSLTDIDGNQVSISDLKGKVILLAFFEHT